MDDSDESAFMKHNRRYKERMCEYGKNATFLNTLLLGRAVRLWDEYGHSFGDTSRQAPRCS